MRQSVLRLTVDGCYPISDKSMGIADHERHKVINRDLLIEKHLDYDRLCW